MRRFYLGLALMAVCSVALLGCGGKKDDDDDYVPKKRRAGGGGVAAAAKLKPVKADGYGVLKGAVVWDGGNAKLQEVEAAFKSSVQGKTDHQYCLKGEAPVAGALPLQPVEAAQFSYRVGANGGLGNVFVWIEPERDHYFDVPKDQLDAIEKEVTIRQPHCAFVPHCAVLFPDRYSDGKRVPTGQKLVVENDAVVSHNAKVQGGPRNGMRSMTMPPKGKPIDLALVPDREPVSLKCDIHGWMTGYLRVFDHPYAAVTSVGADVKNKKWEDLSSPHFGTFEIKGVPVGAKVKLFAWHEELKHLLGQGGKEIVLTKAHDVGKIKAAP